MKHNFWDEVAEFLAKNVGLIISILMGTAVKIAIDSRSKKLSKKDIAIKVVLSFFVGYLTAVYLESHNMEDKVKFVVPIATLIGESLVIWFMQNSKKIIEAIVYSYFPRKDEKK